MNLFSIWLLSDRLSSSMVKCQGYLFIAQILMECLPTMTLIRVHVTVLRYSRINVYEPKISQILFFPTSLSAV